MTEVRPGGGQRCYDPRIAPVDRPGGRRRNRPSRNPAAGRPTVRSDPMQTHADARRAFWETAANALGTIGVSPRVAADATTDIPRPFLSTPVEAKDRPVDDLDCSCLEVPTRSGAIRTAGTGTAAHGPVPASPRHSTRITQGANAFCSAQLRGEHVPSLAHRGLRHGRGSAGACLVCGRRRRRPRPGHGHGRAAGSSRRAHRRGASR
jgi:hypothetical protein